MTTARLNKRTVLGGQYWTIAAIGALTAHGVLLAVVLGVVGAYLVCPAVGRPRSAGPSKFLLRAK